MSGRTEPEIHPNNKIRVQWASTGKPLCEGTCGRQIEQGDGLVLRIGYACT